MISTKINLRSLKYGLFLLIFSIVSSAHSQNGQIVPFDSSSWSFEGDHEIVDYLGKTALSFKEGGKTFLMDAAFQDGAHKSNLKI